MGFTDKFTDFLASEVTEKKVTTLYISLEEFTALFEQAFLSEARTARDLDSLSIAVQGNGIKYVPDSFQLDVFYRQPMTHDRRYYMHCTKASMINLQKYKISIKDEETGNYYTFKGGYGKEPILALEAKIEEYRQKIL